MLTLSPFFLPTSILRKNCWLILLTITRVYVGFSLHNFTRSREKTANMTDVTNSHLLGIIDFKTMRVRVHDKSVRYCYCLFLLDYLYWLLLSNDDKKYLLTKTYSKKENENYNVFTHERKFVNNPCNGSVSRRNCY